MKLKVFKCMASAALFAAAMLVAACGNKNDAITQAETKNVAAGVSAPSIEETKAIAEEGFIYGLPIVMNYAVMYDFCVDHNSGQYKGSVQSDRQRSPGLHLQRHERSSRPTATRPIPCCGWTCAPNRWCSPSRQSRKKRYYSVHVRVTAIPSTTATSAAAPPATTPAITWWSARTGRARPPPGIKKVFRSTTQFSLAVYRTQLFNPEDMPNVDQSPVRLQGPAAFGVSEASPRRLRLPPSNFPRSTRSWSRRISLSTWILRCNSLPPGPEERDIRAKTGPDRRRCRERRFDFKDLVARTQDRKSGWA